MNSWLSYRIAEMFYSDVHYVWCSPNFDGEGVSKNDFSTPPSSTPKEIGVRLMSDIQQGDRHSAKIKSIKKGILKGAELKAKSGVIDLAQLEEIKKIVKQASIYDFRPILYIIPFAQVASILIKVDVAKRAHPLSDEYIIDGLDRNLFDVISYHI